MAQKMVAVLEFALPDGDVFEITDKARGARSIMDQASAEIRKTFPDTKVTFSTSQIRKEGGARPGRKSQAQRDAEAKAAADAAAAAAAGSTTTEAGVAGGTAAAGQPNGETTQAGEPAPPAGRRQQGATVQPPA